jgi:predicted DNA-binding antitoxin AbrB/MazE fold protein
VVSRWRWRYVLPATVEAKISKGGSSPVHAQPWREFWKGLSVKSPYLLVGGRTALMAKPKTIEVVYEDGVFKPLEPVNVNEGEVFKVTVGEQRGILTAGDIEYLRARLESLPKTKVDLNKLDVLYYDSKMRH